MYLLSKILGDPTVGTLRNKKEGRSTHRGLCVGIGFGSFRQFREVGVLSYLGFRLYLSVLNGRLIGPKT